MSQIYGRSNLLMCPKCKGIFYANTLSPHHDRNGEVYPCPNYMCIGGALKDIDELMVEPIALLNYKHYETRFCCSGHSLRGATSESQAYIMFAHELCVPETLPPGWFLDEDNCIRCTEENMAARMYPLIEWAKQLEVNPKYEDWINSQK